MSTAQQLANQFVQYAGSRLQDNLKQIERCLNLLTVEQVWNRPNDVSNAIGNLVVHLRGNVQQWIVAGLGGEVFERDRPAEFAERGPIATAEIFSRLRTTVEKACDVMNNMTPKQLTQAVVIQGYEMTALAAVFHVVEHFSLHAGQIVYATKLLINQDLSLYDAQGRRLDGRRSETP